MIKKHATLDVTAITILLILCASWGLQQVAIKVANEGISPVFQAGLRSLGAAIPLAIWMAARKQSFFEKDGTLWWGLAAGLLFAGEFLFIYWGLEFTNASRAVIFLYLSPFVVAIGVHIFIPGESLSKGQVIGLFCAFAGLLVAFGESFTFPTRTMMIGDAMLIAAAVLWGATTVLIKASPLAVISPSKTLLYQLFVSGVTLPLGAWALGEPGIIAITPTVVGSLVYQVLWVASVTYAAWFWLVQRYPASRLASFSFFTPLFGVLAGALLLDEPVTGALFIALLLVGSGIYLVNRPGEAHKS